MKFIKFTGENSMLRDDVKYEKEPVENTDPILAGPVCEKCGRHTVVNEFICSKTNTPITKYCKQYGGKGCIYGRIGQCSGTKMIKVCHRAKCGKIQEKK
jgi:hypothetical protein